MSSGWLKTDGREEHMWQLTNKASAQEEWKAQLKGWTEADMFWGGCSGVSSLLFVELSSMWREDV